MWKEETPVSRLIDYVGRQNVTVELMIDIIRGRLSSSFIFNITTGVLVLTSKRKTTKVT